MCFHCFRYSRSRDIADRLLWVFARYVRASLQSIKQPVGTCAMAPQSLNGVVDSSLKVWGTANLRVVDASIVPQHLAAHMQSTVYAIGEKVSVVHTYVTCGTDSSHHCSGGRYNQEWKFDWRREQCSRRKRHRLATSYRDAQHRRTSSDESDDLIKI